MHSFSFCLMKTIFVSVLLAFFSETYFQCNFPTDGRQSIMELTFFALGLSLACISAVKIVDSNDCTLLKLLCLVAASLLNLQCHKTMVIILDVTCRLVLPIDCEV